MSSFERKIVEDYLPLIERGNAIAVFWTIDDVLSAASSWDKEISEDEARQVLRHMLDNHDADYGLSWTEVEAWIDIIIEARYA